MAGSIKVEGEHIDGKSTLAGLEQYDKMEAVIDENTRIMEKRIVRKLDMTLMPVVWVLYFFNYMDRNNIAFVTEKCLRKRLKFANFSVFRQAKLDSFEKDLGLVGDQFNVAVSILNVGYVLMQVRNDLYTNTPYQFSD
jgi:hypothetical protein